MEASGFCEIAPMFSCNELVFVLKIVSDTPESLSVQFLKNNNAIDHQNIESFKKLFTIEKLVSDEKKD